MTRNSVWWEAPLSTWSKALQFEYTVLPGSDNQIVGSYWLNHDGLHLQIDHRTIVRLTGPTWNEPTCQALAWTLRNVHQRQYVTWQDAVVEHMADLASLEDGAFTNAWHSMEHITNRVDFRIARPGYFAWVHFADVSSSGSTIREFQSTVEEIIHAFLPDSIVGWPTTGRARQSVLLFCQPPEQLEEWVGEEDMQTSETLRRFFMERRWLKEQLDELSNVLASDALILSKIAVGSRVEDVRELHRGLMSAVACWRGRRFTTQNTRVYIWGEHPWVALLNGIDEEALRRFVEVAEEIAPERTLSLQPEFTETLQGLISANLNVSEAARILYLHRNTLMHRIDKIRDQTGYDVRVFRDAFVLWLVQLLQVPSHDSF